MGTITRKNWRIGFVLKAFNVTVSPSPIDPADEMFDLSLTDAERLHESLGQEIQNARKFLGEAE